jgi:hypothetical protein
MPQRQGTDAVDNHDSYTHVINRVKFPSEEFRNTAMKCRISGFPANVQLRELTFWRRNFFLILAHPVYKCE